MAAARDEHERMAETEVIDSSESEEQDTDDEEKLHGNISAPTGCDPPPKRFFRFRELD